jgi:hypothetical protein
MPDIRLSAALVRAGQSYTLYAAESTTVGETARALAAHEPRLESRTLELLRRFAPEDLLRDADYRPGDRLLIFPNPPRQADSYAAPLPGDRLLKFRSGDLELDSRGRKSLLVGKSDENSAPDIDLRYFIAPGGLEYISRQTMRLNYDELGKVWYAARAGNTRIFLDDLELGGDPIPLNPAQRLRFFRATDDPARSRPISELRLTVEAAQETAGGAGMFAGSLPVAACAGIEREEQTLLASDNLRLGQIMTQLALYNRVLLTPDARLYIARLVPPGQPVSTLNLRGGEFLYGALNLRYAQDALLLHDTHDRSRVYALSADGAEDGLRIGCRAQADQANLWLDVDLYDSLVAEGSDPRPTTTLSPYYARAIYRPAEGTWWISAEPGAHVPVFVNTTRVTSPAPLATGDVLSFGPSLSHYYARLEVEIRGTR